MPADAPETRTLIHLRTGSKICVLVALCLVAVAVYFYFEPMSTRTGSGGVFVCGSAAHPATSRFQKNICENLTDLSLYRAYLFAAMGLIVAAAGVWFFGVDRTLEERRPQLDPQEEYPGPARRGYRGADDWDGDPLPRRRHRPGELDARGTRRTRRERVAADPEDDVRDDDDAFDDRLTARDRRHPSLTRDVTSRRDDR